MNIQYKIVTAHTQDLGTLQSDVEALLADGWEVTGGVSYAMGNVLYQALIKRPSSQSVVFNKESADRMSLIDDMANDLRGQLAKAAQPAPSTPTGEPAFPAVKVTG